MIIDKEIHIVLKYLKKHNKSSFYNIAAEVVREFGTSILFNHDYMADLEKQRLVTMVSTPNNNEVNEIYYKISKHGEDLLRQERNKKIKNGITFTIAPIALFISIISIILSVSDK